MTPTTPPSDAPPVGVPVNGESVRLLIPGDVLMCRLGDIEVVFDRVATHPGCVLLVGWPGYIDWKYLSFLRRPTAQADKTAPEDPNISASNAELLEQALSHPPLSMPAPARIASDAPAEGVGEGDEWMPGLAEAIRDAVGHFRMSEGMSDIAVRAACEHIAALTQVVPADPVAGALKVDDHARAVMDAMPTIKGGWDAAYKIATKTAALSPSPGVTDKLVEALTLAIPSGVCFTNRNVPDSQIVCLDATMGDLRKMAQALAAARQTGEGA